MLIIYDSPKHFLFLLNKYNLKNLTFALVFKNSMSEINCWLQFSKLLNLIPSSKHFSYYLSIFDLIVFEISSIDMKITGFVKKGTVRYNPAIIIIISYIQSVWIYTSLPNNLIVFGIFIIKKRLKLQERTRRKLSAQKWIHSTQFEGFVS